MIVLLSQEADGSVQIQIEPILPIRDPVQAASRTRRQKALVQAETDVQIRAVVEILKSVRRSSFDDLMTQAKEANLHVVRLSG